MTRLPILTLFLFCSVLASTLGAQTVDTSICEILANPQSFDGKTVRIKGTVIAGFDEFAIKDASCGQAVNAIWVAYPEGTKAKAGPVAFLQIQLARNNAVTASDTNRPPVKLDKSKDFKQFDSLLSTPYKSRGICLGCVRYTIHATLVGRLDGAKEAGLVRDNAGRVVAANGFGNLNRYSARLVLQSVSDVSSQEIDFAKAAAASKDDSQRLIPSGDPIAAAHQVVLAFRPGTPEADQLQRAAAAYGEPGEDNGVEIGFGTPNEIPKNDKAKGDRNSPDGLLFNCTFDMDRLKADALATALSHVGTHIADIRGSPPNAAGTNLYEAEYHAWQTTVLSAVGIHRNTLTLSGGYLVWNSAWPAADRSKMVDETIAKFLVDWAALNNSTRP
jgi:hypothetical protein